MPESRESSDSGTGQPGPRVVRRTSGRVWRARTPRQRQAALGASAEVRRAIADGHPLWGRVVEEFSAAGAAAYNLGLVADALEQAEVPYFLVPGISRRAHVVGVSEGHRERFFAVMRKLYDGSVVFAGRPRTGGLVNLGLFVDPGLSKAVLTAPVVRFGVVHLGPSGQVLAGLEAGCDVEFWRDGAEVLQGPAAQREVRMLKPQATVRVLADSLVAPRLNRIADVMPTEEQKPAVVTVRGREFPTFAPFTLRTIDEVTFPIDVVYTWVDGSDPVLRAKRAAHAPPDAAQIARREVGDSRYTSHDELKYSLRSLQMYAGFVRHVYVVTDGQVPQWLDPEAPGLTVVDHRDIFPSSALPVFNSHAIETRLHHIPGLSDHYLYFNDDVFVGRRITPQHFFFGNGIARIPFSPYKIGVGPPHPQEPAPNSAGKNVRRLLQETFGKITTHKLLHTPHPQLREVMCELEESYGAELTRTTHSRFRSITDVATAASFHHHLAYLTGRAVPGRFTFRYVDVAKPDMKAKLAGLRASRGFDFFCLNDVDTPTDRRHAVRRYLHDFLEWYFPFPSSFERRT